MNIIKEIYIIPHGDNFILYAPLIRRIVTINAAAALTLERLANNAEAALENTEFITSLRELGIIDSDDQYPSENSETHKDYYPTSVTFLPTSDCNLRCIYCYADSGARKQYLTLEIGKAAIDLICDNAARRKASSIQVGFLGGGEPFLAWEFVKEIYDYTQFRAREFGLATFFTGVTNGMLSESQAIWLVEHFDYLNISLDGDRDIQNQQRPKKNGGGSYEAVISTINLLREKGFQYSLRATISTLSVDKMPSIAVLFSHELGARKIHFEPLFACGRCKTNHELVPDPLEYARNLIKSYEAIEGKGCELLCSSSRVENLRATYCGALVENFYITPEGYVTACTEVSSSADVLAETFFIGKYNERTGTFDIWSDKRKALISRTVDSLPRCGKCLAKWHCSGGCPAKADGGKVFDSVDTAGCLIARRLVEYHVRNLAEGKDDYLPRVRAKRSLVNAQGP